MSPVALPAALPAAGSSPPSGAGRKAHRHSALAGGRAGAAALLALIAAGCAAGPGGAEPGGRAAAPGGGGVNDTGVDEASSAPAVDSGAPEALERPDDGAGDSAAAGAPPALRVEDLRWSDDGGDGAWSPGEALWLQARLVNAGAEPYDHGPGLQLSSTSPHVTLPEPVASTWGLGPGEGVELRFWGVASPEAPAGEPVPFELQVIATGCGGDVPCPDPAPIAFSVPIGP